MLGALFSFAWLQKGWQRPVLALAASLLLPVTVASPLIPSVNEQIGYRQLSEEIRKPDKGETVYTLGLKGAENMDVYLHRQVIAVDPKAFLEDPSLIPEEATVVVSEKADAAVSGRYSGILRESGRTGSESLAGLYRIWRV